MRLLEGIQNREVYKLGIVYIAIITITAAIANYFTWHAQFSSILLQITVFVLGIMMWIAFYVPMYIFIKRDAWEIRDFGFVINKRLIILSVVLVLFIMTKLKLSFSFVFFYMILLEAIARTGEELFYRGFIYSFVLKLLNKKQNSWLWAVVISSLLFAIVHTQTFLPDNSLNIPSIFISALLLGLLRHWTNSILPGVIIHTVSNGGLLCMLIGILVYLIILIVGRYIGKASKIELNEITANSKD
jgi:membrane protease YdiL (CAAX protease family)